MLRTLVITSCTGEKLYKPENQLLISDFKDQENLIIKEKELREFKSTAGKLYTGKQHVRLMEGIETLRQYYSDQVIDVSILSAGYGLIDEDEEIVPYEVTFNSMNSKEVNEWSTHLQINKNISMKIKDYDLVFFLLGDQYLKSVQLPLLETVEGQKLIFLASKSSKKIIPNIEPYHRIEITQKDTTEFGSGNIELKGFLFKILSKEIIHDKNLLYLIYENPDIIKEVLDRHRIKKDEQLVLFPTETSEGSVKKNKSIKSSKTEILINPDLVAKNYKNFDLRYFMPENDDRVDPNFDFVKDTHTENRDPYLNDVYSHQIYEKPNYDGLLVSMMNINPKKSIDSPQNLKYQKVIDAGGLHNFLRITREFPILGDCGAYSYRNYFEPPFDTKEILDNYEKLGFDIGVSIDHLILKEHADDPVERQRRLSLTESNAEKFIKYHYEGNYKFKPSGIAQGWNVKTYVQSVKNLIDMGYQHISLGGLAFSPNEEIYEILANIAPILPEYMEVHLFGAARLDSIQTFNRLGVTSFDSTTFLRQAWMSAKNNYFTLDGNKYAAIRVPQANPSSRKIKNLLESGQFTLEFLHELEQRSLNAIRQFDKGLLSIEDTLQTVLTYENIVNNNKKTNNEALYTRVLEDAPWKKCNCEICRNVGVEVIIFRGNNRNRRRGFHNTYVFYQKLNEIKKNGLKI